MTVAELIEKLKQMPQDVQVYAEAELADKVILENCRGNVYVRIFKAWLKEWNTEFISRDIKSQKSAKIREQNLTYDRAHSTNGDLISKQELLEKYKCRGSHGNITLHEIVTFPPVDAKPVRHGRWERPTKRRRDWGNIEWCCSECGYGVMPWNNTPFCPKCGARMVKGNNLDIISSIIKNKKIEEYEYD